MVGIYRRTQEALWNLAMRPNKRMQSDFFARYARNKAADAKRYVLVDL